MTRKARPTFVFLLALGVLATALPRAVRAETRTVCFRVQFADDRRECPVGSDKGRRRACNPGGVSDARGHYVQLWDWDSSGKDDFIGTYLIPSTGRTCVAFDWERDYDIGNDRHPDPYLRYPFTVSNTQAGRRIVAVLAEDDNRAIPVAWNRDQHLTNGRPSTTCDMGTFTLGAVRASDQASFAMLMDSAQHLLHIGAQYLTRNIVIRYRRDNPGTSVDEGDGGAVIDMGSLFVGEDRARSGATVTHELGHLVMAHQVGEFMTLDYTKDGDSTHDTNTVEYDSSAFIEGWAEYLRFVSWWNPSNANSRPRIERLGGFDIEDARCLFSDPQSNRGSELQVAKAFWDLDDSNNEPPATPEQLGDRVNLTTDEIVLGLKTFTSGTANRQTRETSLNGPNVYHYYENVRPLLSPENVLVASFALFDQNCLKAQEF